MNKKIVGSVLLCGVAFAAMGCPAEATGGGSSSDYAARLQVAYEKQAINCGYSSTAEAKLQAQVAGALFNGLFKLPGLPTSISEKVTSCTEQAAATCKKASEIAGCEALDAAVGTLKNGDACISEVQCASGACKGGKLSDNGSPSCGVCADGVGEGADCSVDSCAPGLTCSITTTQTGTTTTTVGKCAKSGSAGAKIGENCKGTYCAEGGYCSLDTQATPTTAVCKAQAKIGEECGLSSSSSSVCARGGFCPSATKLCAAIPKLGESCKGTSQCAGGAGCVNELCVDGSSYAALGNACNAVGTRLCGPDSRCKSNGNGSGATCVAAKKLGESCDATSPCAVDLFCSRVSNKCLSYANDLSCPLK